MSTAARLLRCNRLLLRKGAWDLHLISTQRSNRQLTHCRLAASAVVGTGVKLPPLLNMADSKPQLTLQETVTAVSIPPLNRNLGPRIEHIEVTDDGQLSGIITTALQLPMWFVMELIRFGAVWYAPVIPAPAAKAKPHMSAAHLEHIATLRAAGIAKHGRNPALQHPRRVLQDMQVVAGGYVRVHVHPKRFPAAHSVDWATKILADASEYCVVDKPAGVQVPPTVDNLLESVVCCTALALGLPCGSLLNTHRLDVGTSGIVVLAKNPEFAAWFSRVLREKPDNVIKLYRCLTAKPPPMGKMVHYATMHARGTGEPPHTRMRRAATAAAAVAADAVPPQAGTAATGSCMPTGVAVPGRSADCAAAAAAAAAADRAHSECSQAICSGVESEGARCELVVLQVEKVSLTGTAAANWGSSAYETTLQLVTGRTHQIRAQMAAERCPLLGDQLYGALAARWQQEEQQQRSSILHAKQHHTEQLTLQPWRRQEQQQNQECGAQQMLHQCSRSSSDHCLATENGVSSDKSNKAQQQDHVQQQARSVQQVSSPIPVQQPNLPNNVHGGAEWSRVYQEDPSRPIGLQAYTLRVKDVDGRMAGDLEEQHQQRLLKLQHYQQQQQLPCTSCTSAQIGRQARCSSAAGAAVVAHVNDQECLSATWVEFRTGTPWWRSAVTTK